LDPQGNPQPVFCIRTIKSWETFLINIDSIPNANSDVNGNMQNWFYETELEQA